MIEMVVCGYWLVEIVPSHFKSSKVPLAKKLERYYYEAHSLIDINKKETQSEKAKVQEQFLLIQDGLLQRRLKRKYLEFQKWEASTTTKDQRRWQRKFSALADVMWQFLESDSYIEIKKLAYQLRLSTKHLYRVLGVWVNNGLIEMIDLNSHTKSHLAESFDIKRKAAVLTPLVYVIPKDKSGEFNRKWKRKTKQEQI